MQGSFPLVIRAYHGAMNCDAREVHSMLFTICCMVCICAQYGSWLDERVWLSLTILIILLVLLKSTMTLEGNNRLLKRISHVTDYVVQHSVWFVLSNLLSLPVQFYMMAETWSVSQVFWRTHVDYFCFFRSFFFFTISFIFPCRGSHSG